MKKALALVMAIAMVASMAAVSFAAVGELTATKPATPNTYPTLTGVDDVLLYFYSTTDKTLANSVTETEFGKTLYVALGGTTIASWVTADKTAADLKATATWTEGGEYVKSVEVVKKKLSSVDGVPVFDGASKYVYMVAISTVGGSSLDDVEVAGKVYLKGRSGNDKNGDKDKVDAYFTVNFTLGYADGVVNADNASVTGKTLAVYDFSGLDDAAAATAEYKISFGGKFDVTANVKSETKVLMACDEAVIEEVEEAYPDANIDFYACTAKFKKTATVVVDLVPGEEFLYAVVDGEVVEVNGEYDDWAEEFTFKTKKLGTYIISDVELDLAGDVVVANPSTGAAA